MWVQVQQRDRRRDHCAEADTGEKCREQNMGLYAAFVDLTKAAAMDCGKFFARVGCPPTFFTILCQLRERQQGQVKHSGSLSGSLPISERQAGVRPGCRIVLHLLQHLAP